MVINKVDKKDIKQEEVKVEKETKKEKKVKVDKEKEEIKNKNAELNDKTFKKWSISCSYGIRFMGTHTIILSISLRWCTDSYSDIQSNIFYSTFIGGKIIISQKDIISGHIER